MTPEGKVKAYLDKRLKEICTSWFYSPQAGPYGSAGIPDRVGCVNGHFVGIEVKSDTGRPTALQLKVGYQIQEAKGVWAVVHNKEEVDLLIARIKNACFT